MKTLTKTLRIFVIISLACEQLHSAFAQQERGISQQNIDSTENQTQAVCGRIDDAIALRTSVANLSRRKYPWLAAIYKRDDHALKYYCGGSLISSRVVVTVAHCVRQLDAKEVIVVLGRNNLNDYFEAGAVTSDVKSLIVHPDYVDYETDADLALLRLAAQVSYSDSISPICLWSGSADTNEVSNEKAVVAGWGFMGQGQRELNPVSQDLEVEILQKTDCESFTTHFHPARVDRVFCANNTDDRFCYGTSGNGLMIMQNDRWQIRGIISQGIGHLCSPTIYTDLAHYLPWLRANIEQM